MQGRNTRGPSSNVSTSRYHSWRHKTCIRREGICLHFVFLFFVDLAHFARWWANTIEFFSLRLAIFFTILPRPPVRMFCRLTGFIFGPRASTSMSVTIFSKGTGYNSKIGLPSVGDSVDFCSSRFCSGCSSTSIALSWSGLGFAASSCNLADNLSVRASEAGPKTFARRA